MRALGGLRLDTVEALVAGTFEPRAARALRDLWRAIAVEGAPWTERELDDWHRDDGLDAERLVLGPSLTVHVRGRGSVYPVMILSPHWRLFVAPWDGRAKLTLNAEYLATTLRADIVAEVERIGWWLYRTPEVAWRLSRLDLAADATGLELDAFADLDACVTRAVRGRVHLDAEELEQLDELAEYDAIAAGSVAHTRAKITGVTLGTAASRVQFCTYDKLEQARVKGLTWVRPMLEAQGWDGVEPVTRVEARFRQRALDEFPAWDLRSLEALNMVDEWAPALWRYATESCVRYTVPNNDSNRARWPTREDWCAVQGFGAELAAERLRVVSLEVQEERRRRASRDVVRGLVALAAEHEASAAVTPSLMRKARESGQIPELALVSTVFAVYGDLLGARALGIEDRESRAIELGARIARRVHTRAWADDPARAFWPAATKRRLGEQAA